MTVHEARFRRLEQIRQKLICACAGVPHNCQQAWQALPFIAAPGCQSLGERASPPPSPSIPWRAPGCRAACAGRSAPCCSCAAPRPRPPAQPTQRGSQSGQHTSIRWCAERRRMHFGGALWYGLLGFSCQPVHVHPTSHPPSTAPAGVCCLPQASTLCHPNALIYPTCTATQAHSNSPGGRKTHPAELGHEGGQLSVLLVRKVKHLATGVLAAQRHDVCTMEGGWR